MDQLNCPNCNYPDETSGYHYRGKYIRGKKCKGCTYTEKFEVQITEFQVSQRCLIRLDEQQEYLAVVDRKVPTEPTFKFFAKSEGVLAPFAPNEVQTQILMFYANQEWAKWLKIT